MYAGFEWKVSWHGVNGLWSLVAADAYPWLTKLEQR